MNDSGIKDSTAGDGRSCWEQTPEICGVDGALNLEP